MWLLSGRTVKYNSFLLYSNLPFILPIRLFVTNRSDRQYKSYHIHMKSVSSKKICVNVIHVRTTDGIVWGQGDLLVEARVARNAAVGKTTSILADVLSHLHKNLGKLYIVWAILVTCDFGYMNPMIVPCARWDSNPRSLRSHFHNIQFCVKWGRVETVRMMGQIVSYLTKGHKSNFSSKLKQVYYNV